MVPALRGERTVAELAGGLTNTNYKVVTGAGAYVMRVSAKDAGLLAIDRENEYRNSVSAAEAGVGAKVVDYVPEHSLLVLEFIEGPRRAPTTCAGATRSRWSRRPAGGCMPPRPSATTSTCSRSSAGTWGSCRSAASGCPTATSSSSRRCAAIEAAMAVRDEGTVPCNNDLLAENFIDTGGEFRLIDYEYSGMNDACFELGNVWSESNLSLDQLDELVTHYYGRTLRNRIARARLWGLMSKYGWTLWASIQDGVSDIDFDFWSWGMEKYERAVAEFDGPDFDRLLDEVVRED